MTFEQDPEKNVTFYTKPGCSLCEKAMAVVNRVMADIPFHLEVTDITRFPALMQEYGVHIPVVCIDGVQVFRFHVNEAKFRSLLSDAGKQGNNTAARFVCVVTKQI